jgi:hypothetical protein
VKRIISSSVAQLLAPDRRGRVRQLAVVAAATLAAVWLVDASVDSALGEVGFVRGLLHPPLGEIWTRALVAALIVLLFRVTMDRAAFACSRPRWPRPPTASRSPISRGASPTRTRRYSGSMATRPTSSGGGTST